MAKTDLHNRERTLEAKIRLPRPTAFSWPSNCERGVRGPANCFQRQNDRYTENTALSSRKFVERWLLVRIYQKGNVGQLDVADTEVVYDSDANTHGCTGHAVGLRADVMNRQAETDSFRFTDSRSAEPSIDNIVCPRAIDLQGDEKIAPFLASSAPGISASMASTSASASRNWPLLRYSPASSEWAS